MSHCLKDLWIAIDLYSAKVILLVHIFTFISPTKAKREAPWVWFRVQEFEWKIQILQKMSFSNQIVSIQKLHSYQSVVFNYGSFFVFLTFREIIKTVQIESH